MLITNVFLVVILLLILMHIRDFEEFSAERTEKNTLGYMWGGVPTVWNNTLNPPYTYADDGIMYVFNPAAFRK